MATARRAGTSDVTTVNIRAMGTVVGSIIAVTITTHAPMNTASIHAGGSAGTCPVRPAAAIAGMPHIPSGTSISASIVSQPTPVRSHSTEPGSRRSVAGLVPTPMRPPSRALRALGEQPFLLGP